ncbi:MAG: SDR family NAD(P)-dependent oxidoreductase [Balneolaceae bacterium]|nr:SDR family NAD(P)-dependent oxidoreductase [Balneolaceae bacterium]
MNILVSGASRGIGYATVKKLASSGHSVIGTARSKGQLEKLQAEDPAHIKTYPADLTDEQSVQSLAVYVEESFSGVDILVNNAGALINKPFKELEISDWKR